MADYYCAACGTLALPSNSDLVDGRRFVHRACRPDPEPRGDHSFWCVDDGCRGECQPEPVDDYGDPLQDVEPMGGDPAWREREL